MNKICLILTDAEKHELLSLALPFVFHHNHLIDRLPKNIKAKSTPLESLCAKIFNTIIPEISDEDIKIYNDIKVLRTIKICTSSFTLNLLGNEIDTTACWDIPHRACDFINSTDFSARRMFN